MDGFLTIITAWPELTLERMCLIQNIFWFPIIRGSISFTLLKCETYIDFFATVVSTPNLKITNYNCYILQSVHSHIEISFCSYWWMWLFMWLFTFEHDQYSFQRCLPVWFVSAKSCKPIYQRWWLKSYRVRYYYNTNS